MGDGGGVGGVVGGGYELGSSAVGPFPRALYLEFIRHLRVQSKDVGNVPLRLLRSQFYMLDEVEAGLRSGVTTFWVLKSRQCGCTTFFLSIDMLWAFLHKGLLGSFLIHKEEARDDWRQAIQIFYDEIPSRVVIDGQAVRFKPRLIKHNRNLISWNNGSKFRYYIAGTSEKRAGGVGRSSASNYVHATEVAFFGNEEDLRAFRSSLSSQYPHRLAIYESTANGYNHFYDSYQAALTSPVARAIFIGWWRDERNYFSSSSYEYVSYMPVEDLTREERRRVKAVRDLYGFEVTLEQIAWYRWKKRDDFDDDQVMMDQEFPWVPDDAFQATGSQYFSGVSLGEAMKAARVVPFQGYRYRLGMRWEDTSVQGYKDIRAELRVWEHSSRYGHYVIGCDPAYGSSDTADRTVISVWRCYAECIIQVAEFCTPNVSTHQCAWVLAHLAGFYGQHDCRVNLEITGPGMAVWQELQLLVSRMREIRAADDRDDLRNVFKHFSQYLYRRADVVGGGGLAFHTKMTSDLKARFMALFKNSFENEVFGTGLKRAVARSVPLIEEMRHIVNDGGYIGGEGSNKDDRVIAAILAHEGWWTWMRDKLKNQGMTRERSLNIEAAGGEKPLDRLIVDFMKRQNIKVEDQARVLRPDEMRRRGGV